MSAIRQPVVVRSYSRARLTDNRSPFRSHAWATNPADVGMRDGEVSVSNLLKEHTWARLTAVCGRAQRRVVNDLGVEPQILDPHPLVEAVEALQVVRGEHAWYQPV
jgi:hypothetical protein